MKFPLHPFVQMLSNVTSTPHQHGAEAFAYISEGGNLQRSGRGRDT